MSKLSRRQFLKVAASLTASGALAWRGDSLPVIGAGKAIEGDEQPFMPYCLDPYSSRVEVPFYKG